MGVSCIVLWSYPENLNPSQAIETLQKRLEMLGSTEQGTWMVDCEVLQSATNAGGSQGKSVYILHSTEYPRSSFTVLDPSYICLVADNTLDTIFIHLKNFYTHRKPLRVEARGFSREIKGKYVVKFASIQFGSTSKGIVVEVEDKDDCSVSTSWTGLTDLVKSLLHISDNIIIPEHVHKARDGKYTPSDSMVQYAQLFNQIRKVGIK